MSFFSKIFGSKTVSQEESQPVASQSDSLPSKDTDIPAAPSTPAPQSLAEAMLYIVSTRGKQSLLDRTFVNILLDFHVLKDLPAAKSVLLNMVARDYMARLVQSSVWSLDSKTLCQQFINEFGTKEEIVSYIFQSVGYALGHVPDIPVYMEIQPTPAPSQPVPPARPNVPPTHTPSQPKFDPAIPINPCEPWTHYKFPTLDLLKRYPSDDLDLTDPAEIKNKESRIIEVFNSFGFEVQAISGKLCGSFYSFEVSLKDGTRMTKVIRQKDDISLSLGASGVRVIAPIPGKGTIGVEMPADDLQVVSAYRVLSSRTYQDAKMELPIALGIYDGGGDEPEVFMQDLTKLPHLLIAGAVAQGKSVGLCMLLTSLLYKLHPNLLKFVLIDMKRIEFSSFSPTADHFMAALDDFADDPIITDVNKVLRTLSGIHALMEHRKDLLKKAGAHTIQEYNRLFCSHKLNPADGHEYMPYIVTVIDEFADLVLSKGNEFEEAVVRIARIGHTVGVHLVMATYRPTSSIITAQIKAAFPARMAYHTFSKLDSRTILEKQDAYDLVTKGEFLFSCCSDPVRVQGAFIDVPETESLAEFISQQSGPLMPFELEEYYSSDPTEDLGAIDPLFAESAHLIVSTRCGSTSMIMRYFKIGYYRAGHIMDQLEQHSIVGPAQGAKPREVLIQDEMALDCLLHAIK